MLSDAAAARAEIYFVFRALAYATYPAASSSASSDSALSDGLHLAAQRECLQNSPVCAVGPAQAGTELRAPPLLMTRTKRSPLKCTRVSQERDGMRANAANRSGPCVSSREHELACDAFWADADSPQSPHSLQIATAAGTRLRPSMQR